jgi:hypothetical protein
MSLLCVVRFSLLEPIGYHLGQLPTHCKLVRRCGEIPIRMVNLLVVSIDLSAALGETHGKQPTSSLLEL